MKKRATPEELADLYGLTGTHLRQVIAYGERTEDAVRNGQVIEFFLSARSAPEAKAIQFLKADIEKATGHQILFTGYEWVSLHLPGARYTPDWNFLMDDGRWVRVEIKASSFQLQYKDSRSKIRAAAALNPWDDFYEYKMIPKKDGGGWLLTKIVPDPAYVVTLLQAFKEWQNQTGD